MKKITKIYMVPETCLECNYFQEFKYLENGFSKPMLSKHGGKTVAALNSDGSKKFSGICGVSRGLICDGDELKKLYTKSIL
jgi:hypothetical protein